MDLPDSSCELMPHSVPEGELHPAQIAAYQRMTPAEKLRQVDALNLQARRLKEAGVRMRHPDWSEAQVEKEVLQSIIRGVLR